MAENANKAANIEKKVSVKIINSYIGTTGTFYRGKTYEVKSEFAAALIKSGDAEKC